MTPWPSAHRRTRVGPIGPLGHAVADGKSQHGLSSPSGRPRLMAAQRLARARRFCSFFLRAARLRAVFRRLLAGIVTSSLTL
jgi:hypothetical protein